MVSPDSGQTTAGATKGGSLPDGDAGTIGTNGRKDSVSSAENSLDPVHMNNRSTLPGNGYLSAGSLDENPYLKNGTNGAEVAMTLTANGHEARPERLEGVPTWKRALDISCVVISLPCWLPLMLLITLWIKAVSAGPIFYWQERIGYGGRRFMLLKFRSMKVNADTGTHEQYVAGLMEADSPMIKLDSTGDPRLIYGGRLLRALGFDELPQLLNIVSGEMSLVGPRPCTPHEFERYQPWQRKRCATLPGLTGYWQVNGKNRTTFSEMIAMDLFYAENKSLWLDLTIMLRTAPAITAQILDARQPRFWRWARQAVAARPEIGSNSEKTMQKL